MLFKEATTYVCVYIYISRTREKKEIVLFLGSLPPPLGVRILQPRVSLHLIDPLYLYRIPVSTIPASSLLRDSRNPSSRNNKIVHRDISLYDKHSSLSLSRSIRDEDTGFHRFPSPPFPIRGSKICRAKGKSNPAYQYLYLDPSIADHPGEADLHRFTRDSKDGVGGEFWIWLVEKDLAAKGTRKGGEERGKGTRGEVPSRSNKNIYIAFSM